MAGTMNVSDLFCVMCSREPLRNQGISVSKQEELGHCVHHNARLRLETETTSALCPSRCPSCVSKQRQPAHCVHHDARHASQNRDRTRGDRNVQGKHLVRHEVGLRHELRVDLGGPRSFREQRGQTAVCITIPDMHLETYRDQTAGIATYMTGTLNVGNRRRPLRPSRCSVWRVEAKRTETDSQDRHGHGGHDERQEHGQRHALSEGRVHLHVGVGGCQAPPTPNPSTRHRTCEPAPATRTAPRGGTRQAHQRTRGLTTPKYVRLDKVEERVRHCRPPESRRPPGAARSARTGRNRRPQSPAAAL